MFYYLSGTVAHIEPYLAVIDCGGVGYACRTTSYTRSALKKGDKGKVFTHLNVREDAMELYGFATQEELNLFQQLISVSGVGPKAALSNPGLWEGQKDNWDQIFSQLEYRVSVEVSMYE